jgi:TolB protein
MNADGSGVTRLTDGDGIDSWPTWSPDSKRIAYVSHRDANYEIYVMNADGRGPVNVTKHTAQDTSPSWSPDGKRIAFVSNRNGATDIYTVSIK